MRSKYHRTFFHPSSTAVHTATQSRPDLVKQQTGTHWRPTSPTVKADHQTDTTPMAGGDAENLRLEARVVEDAARGAACEGLALKMCAAPASKNRPTERLIRY